MYCPSVDEIKQLRHAEYNTRVDKRRPLLPLYRDILVDLETPVSAYCKTAQQPYSFLLESVTGGERVGRYSFIGIDPYLVMIQRGEKATLHKMDRGHNTVEEIACHDPLAFIEAELGQYHLVSLPGTSR